MRRRIFEAAATVMGAVALSALGILPSFGADLEAGKDLFRRCKICHSLEADGRTLLGPSLHGLFGRKAGTYDNFRFSAAMKESGIVWDDETIAKYLRDPKTFIPGNRMAFPGIHDEAELANLIAYLKEAAK